MRHVSDDERRARLAVRHALAPAFKVDSPEAATRAMTVMHATEPATVPLSYWARVAGFERAHGLRALGEDRTLMKQLAMRRTLFVFPRDLLGAVWPSASARVALTERARVAKDIVAGGIAEDGQGWVDEARAAVLELLASRPDGLSAVEVREALPMLQIKIGAAPGVWAGPRVLTQLGATADLVRGADRHAFPASRPRWTRTEHWLDELPPLLTAADGYRELISRWLQTFGPGTEDDLVWWLGSTKAVVRTALAELAAVAVSLDSGETGWLLPGDLGTTPDPGPWVALLPVLDPTVMGWKSRDFYLAPHRDQIFDTRGNAGTTAWVDGRIVGCWVQDAAGVVAVKLLERVGRETARALEAEAARLTQWLGGIVVGTVYRSPAMKAGAPTTA